MVELNLWVVLTVIEALIILVLLSVFLYLRMKKYKPYFLANTQPEDFIRKYLRKTIEQTRRHAKSLQSRADDGDRVAIKEQQNMVARLNWLILERDFVTATKPSTTFWGNISARIKKLLKRWTEVGFIDGPPDRQQISQATAGVEHEHGDGARHTAINKVDGNDHERELKSRISYLEKQVQKLASYKQLFYGLQSTYDSVVKSYKEMKHQVFDMEFEVADKEKLKNLLEQQEASQHDMEDQMKQMQAQQERLNAELEQLEAAYNAQMEEHEHSLAASTTAPAEALVNAPSAQQITQNMEQIQDIIDNQGIVLRELKATMHTLNIDMETKIQLDERTSELEQNNSELATCIQMLDMERERLHQELMTVKPA